MHFEYERLTMNIIKQANKYKIEPEVSYQEVTTSNVFEKCFLILYFDQKTAFDLTI